MSNYPTVMAWMRSHSRAKRIANDLAARFGDPYRAHRKEHGCDIEYMRWIGTLSKNQQIRHAELQRQLDQAIEVGARGTRE